MAKERIDWTQIEPPVHGSLADLCNVAREAVRAKLGSEIAGGFLGGQSGFDPVVKIEVARDAIHKISEYQANHRELIREGFKHLMKAQEGQE